MSLLRTYIVILIRIWCGSDWFCPCILCMPYMGRIWTVTVRQLPTVWFTLTALLYIIHRCFWRSRKIDCRMLRIYMNSTILEFWIFRIFYAPTLNFNLFKLNWEAEMSQSYPLLYRFIKFTIGVLWYLLYSKIWK